MARPIPLLAPVIRAFFPFNFTWLSFHHSAFLLDG
jgi:hypothetical protein